MRQVTKRRKGKKKESNLKRKKEGKLNEKKKGEKRKIYSA